MKLTDQDCYEIAEFCLNRSNCIGCKLYKNTSCRILRYQEDIFRTIVNQKSEIERLKDENCHDYHCMCLAQQEKDELQKQVDELKAENTELYKEHTALIAGSILAKQNIAKDTAKEILDDLRNTFIEQSSYGCDANQHIGYYDYVVKIGLVIEQVEEYAKLKYGIEYGVEVE